MFTGIVSAALPVAQLQKKPGLLSLAIDFPAAMLDGLNIGASVALDGVCMTVTSIESGRVSFDAMQETLDLTTLGELDVGTLLNVERSFKQQQEVGGHILSGHIDCMAEITAIDEAENKKLVHYQLPEPMLKYVFRKGFIAVNGCSLTVVDVDRPAFGFHISYIPETLRVTTHADKSVGDRVNIEIDRQTQVIVDTVERVLAERAAGADLTG